MTNNMVLAATDDVTKAFVDRVMTKYQHTPQEDWIDICRRMSLQTENPSKFFNYFRQKIIVPGGSILFGLGKPGAHKRWEGADPITISVSNCVVQTIREDSMAGIMEACTRSAKCYQYRMGVGTDLSILRPRNTPVRNSAKFSSGAASFMELFSTVCGTVGQQGRRGALMLTIDINHPDVEEFIIMKKEAKAVLNANVSVKITDAFMEAVKEDNIWDLTWPTNGYWAKRLNKEQKIYKSVRARDLWKKIVDSAYQSAEPGILFWDRVLERPHGFYEEARPLTTNPCSEIPLPDDDVCLLTSIYLPYFVIDPYTEKARFNFKKFSQVVRDGVDFLDQVKDWDIQMAPYEAIAQMGEDWRRIGLGTHGLGDTMWRLGLRYGSQKALAVSAQIYRALMQNSFLKSIELAKLKGKFPKYEFEKEIKCEWLKERLDAASLELMKKYGRRNLALNTVAPTGSISVLSNNCSSGIEPPHDYQYDRFCLGKVFKDIPHGEFQFFKKLTGESKPRKHMVVSHNLTPEERVSMQAVASYWIDHSVSSTVNFLQGATPEDVEAVYLKAHERGCEGITVYVDGSRDNIVSSKGSKTNRPNRLTGATLKFTDKDFINQYITVTKDERGQIQELFISNLDTRANLGIDDAVENLWELGFQEDLGIEMLEHDDPKFFEYQKISIFTSILLRHRVSLNKIISCFEDALAGTLPFYVKVALKTEMPGNIVDQTATDISCPNGNCG